MPAVPDHCPGLPPLAAPDAPTVRVPVPESRPPCRRERTPYPRRPGHATEHVGPGQLS